MPSLQLLQLTEHGKSLLASRRRALALTTGIIVAGGTAVYLQLRLQRRFTSPDSLDVYVGPVNFKEKTNKADGNDGIVKKTRQKKGGLKSLQVLAAILLSHMGQIGARDLLALVAIVALRTALSNRLAKVQGFLFRAAFLRRVPSFLRLIIENLFLCLLQSTLFSTSKYITGTLSLRFRKILTELIHSHYFEVLVSVTTVSWFL
uniref:ABC transmembrane type-1 domain-containing protein n=1 Tax=Nelumbo nucifera TaxID=4432 RepID=A0A822YNP5_NELNU|nr:TPA_asm: hypothetical protein HUJ06_011466 [Nelumbo nucifera]